MAEERFNNDIKSYDIHTYFFQSHEPSMTEAVELRQKLQRDFAAEIEEGKMRIYRVFDRPLGPHPYGMWECDFKSQEMFAKLVPWYVGA